MSSDNTIFLPPVSISESAVGNNNNPPTNSQVKVTAGWDGTDLRLLLTDSAGKLLVTDAGIPPLGQALMAASLPVVIASNQSAVPVSQSGTWNINNVAGTISLPTGASTAANQSSAITQLTDINTALAGTLTITGTVAVSSSALPAGAATSALQGTGNTSLASIDSKLTSPLTVAVNNFPATQPISAASLPLPSGAATQTTLASILANTPAVGQALSAASSPVVIASDQSAIKTENTDGTNNIGTFGNVIAAQYTSTPGRSMPVTAVLQGWDGTTHREVLVDTAGVVQVSSSTDSAVSFTKSGSLAFGSLSTSYQTVLSVTTTSKMLLVFNSLNTPINISLDGGSTDSFVLDAGQSFTMDLGSNGLDIPATTNIQAKYTGNAPTAGMISISAVG